jgi:hypothetical protein
LPPRCWPEGNCCGFSRVGRLARARVVPADQAHGDCLAVRALSPREDFIRSRERGQDLF